MPLIPFADNFLAGAILSLVLPAGLLVAFAIWYVLSAMRLAGTEVTDVVEKIDRTVNPDPSGASQNPDPSGASQTGAPGAEPEARHGSP
jgi:hypothetical protein